MYFLLCPRQGLKIEDGVLHRVYILGLFCPKQGQGLKPSAAPLYPTIGQVPPPPPTGGNATLIMISENNKARNISNELSFSHYFENNSILGHGKHQKSPGEGHGKSWTFIEDQKPYKPCLKIRISRYNV